ncbi:MAG: ATP-binding protein, partial [Candidatus Zixiibacteriota bacterium]
TDFRELLDFMEVVSAPLAMAIQSSRVTDELVAAKELESYFRVSAVVLDDIKDSINLLEHLSPASSTKPAPPSPNLPSSETVSATIKRLRHLELRLSAVPLAQWTIRNVDINNLIRDVIDDLGVRTLERIVVRERFGPPCTVRADFRQLLFLFESLVTNAIDAMPMGGSLIVSTEQTADADEHPAVKITIADTGVGMTPDFMESKLFRPFSGTKKNGLGIGLFQSREIARQLEGSLWVESIPGRGTSVHVILRT